MKKRVLRKKENPTRFFTPREWEKFIYACDNKWRPYFWMMMLTGMRHNEISNIKPKDIDHGNRWIIVLKAKGGKQNIRYVNLSKYAYNYIKSFISENHLGREDVFKFPTRQGMRQYMHKIGKKEKISGWEDLSTHNLRKTHENYLMALDLHQGKVSKHMGHSGKTAMDHYISSAIIKDKKDLEHIRKWLEDIFG